MKSSVCLFGFMLAVMSPAVGETYHSADVNEDYSFNLSEVLRVVQYFNLGHYHQCDSSEDGFCPGYRPVVVGDLVGRVLGPGTNCDQANPGLWCELRGQGLIVEVSDITYIYSDTVAEGVVVSSPQSGQTVSEGTRVLLVVSAGPAPTIPDLSGLSESDAMMDLVEAGIPVCTTRPWPTEASDVTAGLVLRASLVTGSRHPSPDLCVGLVVSSGPTTEGEDCPLGFIQVVAENPEDTQFLLGESRDYYPTFCGSDPVKMTFIGYRADGIQFVWTPGAAALTTLNGTPGWSAFLDPEDPNRAIVTHELASLQVGATDNWFASVEGETEVEGVFTFSVE